MGLFEQVSNMLGGRQHVERLAQGQGNFEDPNSQDFGHWNQLVGSAPPEYVQEAVTHAARRVDPQDYYNHVTPGVGGTDPLGGLSRGGLTSLAGSLLSNLGPNRQAVPGLRTTDPNQMGPDEVANLANYMRQNHPDAFGRAAHQASQQEPGVLQHLLGNKALMLAAAGLAAKYMSSRR